MSEQKKKSDIWMPLYISDYMADTMHLTTEQHGAYLLLLMAAWKGGGSLANNATQLQSIARMTPIKWKANELVLAAFFYVTPELWIHNRVVREFQKAKKNSERRAESGAKGAASRWQNDGKRMANAIANVLQSDGPSPSPN